MDQKATEGSCYAGVLLFETPACFQLDEKTPFVCMDHSASGCSVTNGSSTLTCNIGGLSFGKPNVTTVLQLRAVSAGTGLIVVNATGVSVLGAAFQTRATQLVSLALCAAAQGDRCTCSE